MDSNRQAWGCLKVFEYCMRVSGPASSSFCVGSVTKITLCSHLGDAVEGGMLLPTAIPVSSKKKEKRGDFLLIIGVVANIRDSEKVSPTLSIQSLCSMSPARLSPEQGSEDCEGVFGVHSCYSIAHPMPSRLVALLIFLIP